MEKKADYLFESSWEVCNKVGGIYTVVKSKVRAMQEHYDNYFLIGPYFEEKAESSFNEFEEIPDFLKKAFEEMNELGVECHYGEWEVAGDPKTVLLDFDGLVDKKGEIKKKLWEEYNIDSMNSGWDFEEPMVWSWAVGILMERISEYLGKMNIIHHCHEWLSSFSILYLEEKRPEVKTVFTTHATMLGRSIAGAGEHLYGKLQDLDVEKEVKEHQVKDKYTTEKAAAHACDVFTTVSEITAMEAEKILDREVDVVLNNGITVEKFPTIEDTTMMHVKNREKIREFLSYYFFPHYDFELKHNLIYFLVGRYEYKNKGMDILVEALSKLNEELKEEDSKRTITMFFWVPMDHNGIREEILDNRHYYNHIKNTLESNSDEMIKNLLYDLICQKCSMEESIFTNEFIEELKKDVSQFKREGNPPITTHEIPDYEENDLVQDLIDAGLTNEEEEKVKVIVYPVYLDGNDLLLDLPYYEALSAGHLGIFPSYYEPWGYTPVESMSLGVPAVTTDLAGFGRFIKPNVLDENPGIFVLERFGKSEEESVDGLFNILSKFAHYDHAERVQNKINAKQMSILTDWKHFVKNYIQAHNQALET